jgi:hypothetical protein
MTQQQRSLPATQLAVVNSSSTYCFDWLARRE